MYTSALWSCVVCIYDRYKDEYAYIYIYIYIFLRLSYNTHINTMRISLFVYITKTIETRNEDVYIYI